VKVDRIRLFLYRLIDRELYTTYKKLVEKGGVVDTEEFIETVENENNEKNGEENEDDMIREAIQGGGADRLAYLTTTLPTLTNYQVANDRTVCTTHKDKAQCANSPHCKWAYDECHTMLTDRMAITFVNKMSEELASADMKALELLKVGNYFVSDIVDYNRFKERSNQKIIRSNSNTIKKALTDLFGKENVPKIGKRRGNKSLEVNYAQMNSDNPIRDMRGYYLQHVMDNNLSIFRAYVNGYHWHRHPYYDNDSRNLGFYSPLQTDLANYFRSLVIDWLQDTKNNNLIQSDLMKYMDAKRSSKDPISDFLIKLGTDVVTVTNGVVELYILNKIQQIPIVVYDDNGNVVQVYDDGLKFHSRDKIDMTKEEIDSLIKNKNPIQLKFNYITQINVPDEIYAQYS
jgi:hypothetical protein